MNKITRTIEQRDSILNNLWNILLTSKIEVDREDFFNFLSLDLESNLSPDFINKHYEGLNYYLSLYNNLLGESSMLGINPYINMILANEISSLTILSEIEHMEEKSMALLQRLMPKTTSLRLVNLESLIKEIIEGRLVELLEANKNLRPLLILVCLVIIRTVINENLNDDREDQQEDREEEAQALYRLNTKAGTLHSLDCRIGKKSKESRLIYCQDQLEGKNFKKCGICFK